MFVSIDSAAAGSCGIFPEQGWSLSPLHWHVDPEPLDHQGGPVVALKIDGKIVSLGAALCWLLICVFSKMLLVYLMESFDFS